MNKLEVYADLWCPFAYVGLVEAIAQRDATGAGTPITVRSWPLELINGEPMTSLKAQANIAALREQVAPRLFAGFRPENFPTSTLAGLSLVAAVYEKDPEQGEALSMDLRELLFEQGVDINDEAVLAELAARYAVDLKAASKHEGVMNDWGEGQKRGVKGSPHFFCGESDMFCPGLNIKKNSDGQLCIEETHERVEEFLRACLV